MTIPVVTLLQVPDSKLELACKVKFVADDGHRTMALFGFINFTLRKTGEGGAADTLVIIRLKTVAP